MSDSSDADEAVDADVPDAVLEWLSSVAEERGVSETELLRSLLAGDTADGTGGGDVDDAELERVEREFRELVEDVRERIVQVKRETDEKAPVDHTHHELNSTLEQLGHDVGSLEAEVNRLEERLSAGFGNYEEILTYLTETTDSLDRKLGRLASAIIDLREQVGDAARDEVRRTALAHLTDTANRHGVEKAKCEDCGEGVNIGMLVEPQCPHCDSAFSALEPKSGFFRSSVLHTGTMPALEAGPEEGEDETATLEAMVEDAASGGETAPSFDVDEEPEPATQPEPATPAEPPEEDASPVDEETDAPAAAGDGGGPETDGQSPLERVDGIGSAYADRLQDAGIDDLLSLAVADPEALGEDIDVPATTVAEWVAQADNLTGT